MPLGDTSRKAETAGLFSLNEMPVSYLTISAGIGSFLDGGSFKMVSFPASAVTDGADFDMRVSGDSRESVYHDGQSIWEKQYAPRAISSQADFQVVGRVH